MDDQQFDLLARRLAAGMSRRGLIRTLGGAILGGTLAVDRRRSGLASGDPGNPVGDSAPLCPEIKVCGDFCCGKLETCVGLAEPSFPTDDRRDAGGTGKLECICVSGYERNRAGECVCPAANVCGDVCCTEGETCCDGECRLVVADPNNCGGCGIVCPEGWDCAGGECRCKQLGEYCPADGACCSEYSCSDEHRCCIELGGACEFDSDCCEGCARCLYGTCQSICGPCQTCLLGACVDQCEAGQTCCGETCRVPGPNDCGCSGPCPFGWFCSDGGRCCTYEDGHEVCKQEWAGS